MCKQLDLVMVKYTLCLKARDVPVMVKISFFFLSYFYTVFSVLLKATSTCGKEEMKSELSDL